MVDADPENDQTAQALLRDIAARSPEDPTGRFNVAQFMLETEGADAARAEPRRLVGSESDSAPFFQVLARLDFALGRRQEAIGGRLRTLT
jgi:predicted Zn-dependent protease